MADDQGHPDDDAAQKPTRESDQAPVVDEGSPADEDSNVTAGESAQEPETPPTDDGSDKPAHRKTPHAKDEPDRKPTRKGLRELLDHKHEKVVQLTQRTESLQNEVRDLKDKWLRSVAEFDNYRKRTRKEWELLQQRTKAEIILDVLTSVDDFERAFSVVGDRDDDFIRGMRLTYNNLRYSLEKIGVRKIEALNSAFDPTYHMAVAQIDRDGAESNQVVEVVQEGYCLGDIVVRPAKVVVAK